jgi:nucleoside-diphosphate-sugar epimerase
MAMVHEGLPPDNYINPKNLSYLDKAMLKEVFKKGWFCDIKDIRKILRYDPEYDLRKGFQLTFEWYKTNRWL